MLRNRPELTAEHICAVVFQNHNCGPRHEPQKLLVNIDQGGQRLTKSKPLTRTNEPHVVVVQITDPHLDMHYIAGGNAKCQHGACCNKWQGLPKQASDAAGFWGDYNRCDSPQRAVNNTFYQIKSQHSKIDYIYFTGRLAPLSNVIYHFALLIVVLSCLSNHPLFTFQ